MDHARRYDTEQNKDLTRPLSRSIPATAHRDRLSSAQSHFSGSHFSGSNERPFRRTTAHFGHQRHPAFASKSPRLNQRSVLKTQISLAEWRDVEKRKKKILERHEVAKRRVRQNPIRRVNSPAFERPATSGSFTSRTVPSNVEDKALTQGRNKDQSKAAGTGQEEQHPATSPAISPATSPATARRRAIEQKRKEIEEVYGRDCGIFSTVVQKLVSKEPSLVPAIRFSMQENLQEIGARCVTAMEQFITQYESKTVSQ